MLQRRHVFAACLQETWRAGFAADLYTESGYTLIEWGPPLQNGRGSRGVGLVLSRAATAAWQKAGGQHWKDDDARVLAIRMEVQDVRTRKGLCVFLVSGYAPDSSKPAAEIDAYYDALSRVLAHRHRGDVLVVGTDANASVGRGSLAGGAADHGNAVGPHGLAHMNAAGFRLRTFMETRELESLASYFRKRWYGTWLNPFSKREHQLDHFIVEQSEHRRFTDAGACSGQLIGSDHRGVLCRLRIATALERRRDAGSRSKLMRLDFSELREPRAQACFARAVVRHVQETCDAGGLPPYAALADAVQATAVERLPKRARVSPGWFAGQSSALQRLIDVRNRRFDAHHNQPTPGSAALLRSAKAELQLTVREAKSNWILAKCERLSDGVIGGSGSKAAWDVVQEFRRGLQSARQPAPAKMRFADGTMACSAEENANVHAEHYRQLYGHTPTFDATVLSMLRRRPVMPGLDHVPTGVEIRRCVGKLHDTSPGASGLPALAWKALISTSAGYDLVEGMVLHFWATACVPPEWETGLLAILFKKGDRAAPGNYRGIMLLEVAYKIVGNLLLERLKPVKESLPHEAQCGFRGGRSTMDATWTIKMLVKKRREHGLPTWLLFIDLVKAFDRVPRELLWEVMLLYGVPPLLVALVVALHERVIVSFDVEGVKREMPSIIGVKQGDLLGPDLFIFLICAIMDSWAATHSYPLCVMRSRPDFVLTGRRPATRGEDFTVSDSEYADDTGLPFESRADVEEQTPELIVHFGRWGMEIHTGTETKSSKSEVLFCAAPRGCYSDPSTCDNVDLSDIKLPGGRLMGVVDKFCYLGSIVARNGSDALDVNSRLQSAAKAFGALRKCVFTSNSVSRQAKRVVYERLVLAIGLFGCECWCLSAVLEQRLRSFHAQCVRAMSRVTLKHTFAQHISTQELEQELGLETIDAYVSRRQLRWLGHVSRMDFDSRMPRRMLSSWVPAKRTAGCPQMTYGRSIRKALKKFNIAPEEWPELAADRVAWRAAISGKPRAARRKPPPQLLQTPPPQIPVSIPTPLSSLPPCPPLRQNVPPLTAAISTPLLPMPMSSLDASPFRVARPIRMRAPPRRLLHE